MNQLILILGVVLSAGSLVHCFNIFKSYQIQNLTLLEDILELEASSSDSDGAFLSRKRRDQIAVSDGTKKNTKSWPYPCCQAGIDPKYTINWEYVRPCYAIPRHYVTLHHIRSTDRNSKDFKDGIAMMKNDVMCQIQCVAQKYNMADKNGIVILDGLNKFMSTSLEGTWMATVAKQVATKCFNQIQTESNNYLKTKTPTTCNPALATLIHCLHREIEINCPSKYVGNIEECLRQIDSDYKHF
ncbi:hypothetical protein PPYR_09201 [Photinus pyralis]|uniref:Uncharacterized protein n=1 Tax=Photinus pyralis TaxID=7054 RepID=A0A5N4ALW3_PHOPY|nr:uncharacterized protein LOC116171992 [Photinus pyralis]KAB0798208.1 hypothetical protein PPYR_09201 [Photinus pyralis]